MAPKFLQRLVHPDPAPPNFAQGRTVPEQESNPISRLLFLWIGPFLSTGFSRPLQTDDLWTLKDDLLASNVTNELEHGFYSQCAPKNRPAHLREELRRPDDEDDEQEEVSLSEKPIDDEKVEKNTAEASKSPEKKSKYNPSLLGALLSTFAYRFWFSGILQLLGDTLKTTTPLLNKVLLTWLVEAYVWARLSDEQRASGLLAQPRGVGYGIGLAFALFAMQEVSSLLNNHSMQIGLRNGMVMKTALTGNIFRKALRLSGRARLAHTSGQITTLIATDAPKFDAIAQLGHHMWIAPIQLIIGFGLLIREIGYSAVVGLGVLIVALPFQAILTKIMFDQRGKAVKITDSRIRLITEILQGIRLLKFYGWEDFYISRVQRMRMREIQKVKNYAYAASGLMAMLVSLPTCATIMSFIVYSLTGHDLNVVVIFTALQFFNIIRIPLVMFPLVLAFFADSLVALNRMSDLFLAEELVNPYTIAPSPHYAVQVDGDFTWETAGKLVEKHEEDLDPVRKMMKKQEEEVKKKEEAKKAKERKKLEKKGLLPTSEKDALKEEEETPKETPFALINLKLEVPKGAFVGIVGRIGSGKSSILQALIGEMRRTRGDSPSFTGGVAYVQQTPWIRNASILQNILLGQSSDQARLDQTIDACSLRHDLENLPYGIDTEIGEKGVNLSGGQKARVALARAVYSTSEVVLLDDPLSAVDADVGKALVDNCLLSGPLASRTRILVTHALHVLDKMDYVYVVDEGVIKGHGTYQELLKDNSVFARLIADYGSHGQGGVTSGPLQIGIPLKAGTQASETQSRLMQDEERNVGAVSWDVYRHYVRHAGSWGWIVAIAIILVALQCAQVAENLILSFWVSLRIPGFDNGKYMAVYGSMAIAQGLLTFALSLCFTFFGLFAALNMFTAALTHVLKSPMSFFDTTPMGRILTRFSKDQDSIDSELSMLYMQFTMSIAAIFGTAGLVFYTFPILGIIFAPLGILYATASLYYRRSSVETKRLDSLMRSILYSSFSESLTGLSTIRAYREQKRAIADAERGMDLENRATYMTFSIQRWLAIRLDLFGNILVLGIALFAAGYRTSVDPSKVGLVLSYTLSVTILFSEIINQFTYIEQTMNAVERVLTYVSLPGEAPSITDKEPPASWPHNGALSFRDVEMRYRDGLPLVLKKVSFEVKAGEKIGIVGRTGSGKTSLLQALFRIVELHSGEIVIDNHNVADIGLNVLRNRLALVPQDGTLFMGTLRQNIDPLGTRTDAELIQVLQRAWLLPRDGSHEPTLENKFSLDANVSDEGSNFSAGEKQLLSLCRALVKDSRIIVLDEATSNVDVETDSKIQRTIQTEFASSTLLCIAHRLNTIAYYDRVLVMDGGEVAEFDTVLNLFDNEDSIFRNLCNQANLHRSDILRIRQEHGAAAQETS